MIQGNKSNITEEKRLDGIVNSVFLLAWAGIMCSNLNVNIGVRRPI
jgi:hypothetical protein